MSAPIYTADKVDYSVYLVTGRELLPPGKDYYESLEESLKDGSVTVVQVREKNIDSGEFYDIARRTKLLTDKYSIPLIINDRLDICLSIRAAGLHIGQTDLPPSIARSLLPAGSILGLSVATAEEAKKAVKEGLVDYVGIGPVWETKSKDVSKKVVLGPSGVGKILDVLAEGTGKRVKSVAIGGVHLPNVPHLILGSTSPKHGNWLDGIAVISDIVSSSAPGKAAKELKEAVGRAKSYGMNDGDQKLAVTGIANQRTEEQWLNHVIDLMDVVREKRPLAHQITNTVVANDSANATLALGGSPIMATHPKDVKDLSSAIDALLINFGTISDKEGMIVAGQEANKNRKPLIFDPVAVGATAYRRDTAKELLAAWQPSVIKGNAGEIGALAGSLEVASRGVDSVGSGFKDPGEVVRLLARETRAVVVMTGKEDWISDGETVLKLSNGHHLMGEITGSGCMTGTAITVFCGAARIAASSADQSAASSLVQGDILLGAVSALLVYTIAGEKAGEREDVKGPGTFRSAFIDEMWKVRGEDVRERCKLEVVR